MEEYCMDRRSFLTKATVGGVAAAGAATLAAPAIAQESPDSPYANVLVVREKDKDRPEFAKLVSIYHSPAVKEFIQTKFKGAVVAAW